MHRKPLLGVDLKSVLIFLGIGAALLLLVVLEPIGFLSLEEACCVVEELLGELCLSRAKSASERRAAEHTFIP